MEQIGPLKDEWEDALSIAESTGRIALAGPVAELQRIQRATEAAEVRTCYSYAHYYLVKGEGLVVDGFLAFMSQDEAASSRAIQDAAKALNSWDVALMEFE